MFEKLGVKPGMKLLFLNPPDGYAAALPRTVEVRTRVAGVLDLIQFFAPDRAALEGRFPILKRHLAQNGMLWISWPKRLSGIQTDVDENLVREVGLHNGLVDVKVASVNDTWSALKFVRRLSDRRPATR